MDYQKLSQISTEVDVPFKHDKVVDSAKNLKATFHNKRSLKVEDSAKIKLRRRIKDALAETESTEEAIQVALEALRTEDPEFVVSTVIEVLAGIIDALSRTKEDPSTDVDAPVDDSTKPIEDSTFNVGDPYDMNGVTGKIKEVQDDKIIVETINDEGDIEDVEVTL